jgi:hypothetical protein
MCTKSFDYEGLILKELRDRRRVDLDRVEKIDVIHGKMIVEYSGWPACRRRAGQELPRVRFEGV